MATSNADLKTRIATSRHEILSYKPGKTVSCDDERVVFPDKLVVGMIDIYRNLRRGYAPDIVPALRRALHGDVKPSKHADKQQTSTEDQEEYLTDSIFVITRRCKYDVFENVVQDLDRKVGCMALFVDPCVFKEYPERIKKIETIIGRVPLCAIFPYGDIPNAIHELKHLGITDMYKITFPNYIRSDEDQLQWLDFLRGCLHEGDRITMNDLKEICTNPRCRLQERVDNLKEIVAEKGRNETTLRNLVEELRKGRVRDRARLENDNWSIELSWKKEHDHKEQLLEQLERENWKLRTKIQLESEIRSAEQKKKAETHKWSFIPWSTSGKQAQGGTSSVEDNSTGGLGMSGTLQGGEEPPNDEFAGILQQIADDLYDEAKIDSLAGQLGILHGDIQRALMTNMRFGRVTSDGTRHMLKQWRRGVSREDERIELTKALQAAKLVNLADLYLSKGVAEEQIDAEYANEDVIDEHLSNRDETPLEQDRTKGHTGTQVHQKATSSSNYSSRDEHTGDMASKTQEDLTDGSRNQHIDQSPERSTEDLVESEVPSAEASSEEVNPGDDMNNVSGIQPSEQSPSHETQVLHVNMSEIASLVSYGGKSNEESTTLDTNHVGGIISNEEDLVSQLVLTDTSPEKILLIFLVKIIMDVSQKTLSL